MVEKSKLQSGRPCKLTPEAVATIVKHVRQGCPRYVAASAAGLGRSTFLRWLNRGRKERRGQFRDFWDAIKKAEAEAVVARIQNINAAAERGTWQAAAWWLERSRPEHFATNQKEIRELARELRELRHKLEAR